MITDGYGFDRAFEALQNTLEELLGALEGSEGLAILNDARDGHGLDPLTRADFENVRAHFRPMLRIVDDCERAAFGE